ncbi:hypothetical protein D6B98_38750 [Bradyrhizobium sp. LVM 105]|nr:hypothetical protein D6B98_38750 [Bradyrhizobium sp. LVM 105]
MILRALVSSINSVLFFAQAIDRRVVPVVGGNDLVDRFYFPVLADRVYSAAPSVVVEIRLGSVNMPID